MAAESPDAPPPPPPSSSSSQPRSSLYANLLSSASPGASTGQTISRAPVVFSPSGARDSQQDEAAALKNAALRFQPTKRPIPAQKQKPKPAFSKLHAHLSPSEPADKPAAPGQPPPAAPAKSTLADWAADDDDINGFYAGAKRQRGGRKKRKKNKEQAIVVQDWDDIYDPSRPNSYDDYRRSEERFREIRDWKDRLYAHRLHRRRASSELSDDSARPAHSMDRTFAPPPNYSFAPPPASSDRDSDEHMPPPPNDDGPPPPPPADLPNDVTGEDAYARRMRMSGMSTADAAATPPPPPPPPSDPPPPAQPPQGTISRAPVRYQLPAAPADIPSSEAELEEVFRQEADEGEANSSLPEDAAGTANDGDSAAPRSARPGQRGFAQRLMSKYGWTQGSGLGASGTGIVNPLRVQVEKRKKKSDAEGGGFVGPAGKGKIIGSKQGPANQANEASAGDDLPALSEVVVLRGMVDGLDLDAELGEGNLMQEIGEECAEKYGRVERVFIDRNHSGTVPVFVKFTSQLSALRAVQALEGRMFNGNAIQARYFDPEKFEAGIYE